MNAIDKSIKQAFVQAIYHLKLNSFFNIVKDAGIYGKNGSVIDFIGLDRNEGNIKGLENYNIGLIEEAQQVSRTALDLWVPTLAKTEDSKLIFLLNRTNISDPVDIDYIQNQGANTEVHYVNCCDNPFLSQTSELERLECLRVHPERYNHIWLGHHDLNADNLLINVGLVVKATQSDIRYDEHAPLIMGVDPARLGGDRFAICLRRGRSVLGVKVLPKMDTNQSSHALFEFAKKHNPKRIFIDVGGLGVGVYDNLKAFGLTGLKSVNFGGKANNEDDYCLRRDEMYGQAKKWFEENDTSILDTDSFKNQLITELSTITKGWDTRGRLRLPSKDTFEKKGNKSPDLADAFALTFAEPVAVDSALQNNYYGYNKPRIAHGVGHVGF